MDVAAIDVQALAKHYGQFSALNGVDLCVPTGTLFGLVGPNGAGKSTLIKALVGALRPSAGSARVLGLDPLRDRAALRRRIGYMPQSPALYQDLSARDNVSFFAGAHDVPDLDTRVEKILQLTDLAGRIDEPVRQFSGGMQRRVSLASALVHEPDILFLDEPTAAVDPALRARFWQSFRDQAARGTTLFISTHLMDEAMLCDHVAVMRRGQVVVSAPPRDLLARGATRVTISAREGNDTRTIGGRPEDLAEALRQFGLRQDITGVAIDADSLEAVLLKLFDKQDAGADLA
jgi:ABC-2 type transport system ATP-binding protein